MKNIKIGENTARLPLVESRDDECALEDLVVDALKTEPIMSCANEYLTVCPGRESAYPKNSSPKTSSASLYRGRQLTLITQAIAIRAGSSCEKPSPCEGGALSYGNIRTSG